MPRKRKKKEIQCQHYRWLLGQRSGIYYADGRSNPVNLGRHSLDTRDKTEAMAELKKLDLRMAVRQGLADLAQLANIGQSAVSIESGRKRFDEHIQRPTVVGGSRKSTQDRYRPPLDKFQAFAQRHGIQSWNDVTAHVLDRYAAWLESKRYKQSTMALELATIKQVVRLLVNEKLIPDSSALTYKVRRPSGTTRYCWEPEEVRAMIDHCLRDPDLVWLGHVVVGLAFTGLRISELISLRWSDIDLDHGMIRLTDESHSSAADRRTTKSGRSRTLPIHDEFRGVLESMDYSANGPVFTIPGQTRFRDDKARAVFKAKVLKVLAPQFPHPRFLEGGFHSFRHYFCSVASNSGIPERVVMQWLGHRDSDMVQRYYHLSDQESQRQMSRINVLPIAADVRSRTLPSPKPGGPSSQRPTTANDSKAQRG